MKAANKKAKLKCPECHRGDFENLRNLGVHRKFQHGVPGQSAASVYKRKHEQNEKLAEDPNHDQDRAREPQEPQGAVEALPSIAAAQAAATITPVLVGYAVAKLEHLAETIARAQAVPEREFVKLVARQLVALRDR
jgi:hypothetical protein